MGAEVHVKDEVRFPGKWAFFGFDDDKLAKMIPTSAECYSCHAEKCRRGHDLRAVLSDTAGDREEEEHAQPRVCEGNSERRASPLTPRRQN